MEQVYFSHSYRDVSINSYFLGRLIEEKISLWADQKTDVWCVPKLERYMLESSGFVSIIPRRAAADGPLTYSPYIGHELSLARRSRVPRLLFVDDVVLRRHRDAFPSDAVPFVYDEPERDRRQHDESIKAFKRKLEGRRHVPAPARSNRLATLVVPDRKDLLPAADGVAAVLRAESYDVVELKGRRLQQAFENIRFFEDLLGSEVCIFLLGESLSYANVIHAMAYAHCIPTMRLRHDRRATDAQPGVTGVIRWSDTRQLVAEFKKQLDSFRKGLVRPVEMAQTSNPTEVAREMGTMQWSAGPGQFWDPHDGPSLVRHVRPQHAFVQDQVARVRRERGRDLGTARDRVSSMEVCRQLYDGIKRHRFIYELEPTPMLRGRQKIRTPADIEAHRCATCIDLACLFAALLEVAYQRPVVIVTEGPGFAHALIGYRAPDEPEWEVAPTAGTLRGALTRGDVVVFEPTGAAEADRAVSGAGEREGQAGERVLDFMAAKEAAEKHLLRGDVHIRYVVDVCQLRRLNPDG